MQQPKVPTVAYVGGQPTAAGPPTYVMRMQPAVVQSFNSKHSKIIGITLILCAFAGFACNSVELGVGLTQYYYYGFIWGLVCHGFWTGIMCSIAGGFGIGAARCKTKSQILTFNVLCIISLPLTFAEFIIGIVGASLTGTGYCYDSACEHVRDPLVAMESLMVILAVIQGVVAIWGSAICCKAYNCCSTGPEYYMQTMSNNGVPMIMILNQPPTATMSPAGAPVAGYPQVYPAQMAPQYNIYTNQGFYSPPQLYPPAPVNQNNEKSSTADPPSYTVDTKSS